MNRAIAATRGPYCTGPSAPARLGPLSAPAFTLDQLVLGHLGAHRLQVEDLAALHAGHRPARQPGRFSFAAAAASAPACPALTRRRPGGIPRVLLAPGLQLSDPLPGLRQLRARLPHGGYRLGQLPAQRRHQRGQNLIRRRLFLTGHTRTLRPAGAHRTDSRHLAAPAGYPRRPSSIRGVAVNRLPGSAAARILSRCSQMLT